MSRESRFDERRQFVRELGIGDAQLYRSLDDESRGQLQLVGAAGMQESDDEDQDDLNDV